MFLSVYICENVMVYTYMHVHICEEHYVCENMMCYNRVCV